MSRTNTVTKKNNKPWGTTTVQLRKKAKRPIMPAPTDLLVEEDRNELQKKRLAKFLKRTNKMR